jgi:rubrerythrin
MTESMGGVVPVGNMLNGITADLVGEYDPSGQTFIRLLDAVDRHATLEVEALGQYEHLAQASGDPVIALVMRLILEDEERHHGLLKRISSTLRDALNWTYSPDALPRLTTPVTATGEDLPALARALIDEEKTGAQALRGLAQREKGLGSGLDSLLLEMMATDSEKHARLLRFVQRRLEARARATKDQALGT